MNRLKGPLLLMLGALIFQPEQVLAQCYSGPVFRSYSSPIYHTPVYQPAVVEKVVVERQVENIIQPIVIQERLAPAFVFQVVQPAPAQQCCQSGAAAVTTPLAPGSVTSAQTVVQGQPPAQGVVQQGAPPAQPPPQAVQQSPQPNSDVLVDAIAARVVAKLTGGQDDSTLPVVQIPGAIPGAPPGYNVPPPPPPPAYTPQSKSQQLDQRVIAHFARPDDFGCIKCHGNGATKGSLVIFDSQGQFNPMYTDGRPLPKTKLLETIAAGQMPQKAQVDPNYRVPPELVELTKQWSAVP